MSGKILSAARKDFRKIASSGGFEEAMTLKNPDGSVFLIFKNLHVGHNMAFDTDGARLSSESISIGIDMLLLDSVGYPYINPKTLKPDFKGHKVEAPDYTGIIQKYVINEWYPNKTFGYMNCILGHSKD